MTLSSTKPFVRSLPPFGWLTLGLSVMDRYIIAELVMPFLFGVAAFSSLGLALGSLFDLVRKVTEAGLPVALAMQILTLKMPECVALALPMSTLLATLMVYSRLSSDSELIGLRSCGVSIYRLIVPAILLSLVATGLTFALNESIVPAANYQASISLERALKEERPTFREKDIFYQEYRDVRQPNGERDQTLARIFYAKQFDGERMKGLTILDFSQTGLNQIVASESAVWNPQQSTWDFFNGTIYVIAPDGSYRNILKFDTQQLQLPRTPLDLANRGRDFREMSIVQIRDYAKLVRQSGDEKKVRKLGLRIQQRTAFPFVCVVFGLVGATLGTRPRRTGKATSFSISILIIFSYYLLLFICDSLGQLEVLSAFTAAWLPTIAGLTAGMVLLVRSAR